jgi:hypothetical protein
MSGSLRYAVTALLFAAMVITLVYVGTLTSWGVSGAIAGTCSHGKCAPPASILDGYLR